MNLGFIANYFYTFVFINLISFLIYFISLKIYNSINYEHEQLYLFFSKKIKSFNVIKISILSLFFLISFISSIIFLTSRDSLVIGFLLVVVYYFFCGFCIIFYFKKDKNISFFLYCLIPIILLFNQNISNSYLEFLFLIISLSAFILSIFLIQIEILLSKNNSLKNTGKLKTNVSKKNQPLSFRDFLVSNKNQLTIMYSNNLIFFLISCVIIML
jgi:hypothetical protein